jgi:hypothetical protein
MSQPDYSSPDHRAENLMLGKFARAYAEIRAVINDERWQSNPVSDLRVVCEVLDAQLAQAFELPPSTLAKAFRAAIDPALVFKTRHDEAGFPTA